jgi:hypothetical protein
MIKTIMPINIPPGPKPIIPPQPLQSPGCPVEYGQQEIRPITKDKQRRSIENFFILFTPFPVP